MNTAAVKCPYCHSPRPLPGGEDEELLIRCGRCHGVFSYIPRSGKVRFRGRRSWYDVLGVPATASSADIDERCRELKARFGDRIAKGGAPGLRGLDEACFVLSDLDRRAGYDASLLHDASADSAGPPDAGLPPAMTAPVLAGLVILAAALVAVLVTAVVLVVRSGP